MHAKANNVFIINTLTPELPIVSVNLLDMSVNLLATPYNHLLAQTSHYQYKVKYGTQLVIKRIKQLTLPAMIKIENLSKTFRTEEVETTALNQVSLHVKEGEYVAIMGPSGCGKSTLLNIIGLLDNPSEGNYYFNGQEVGHLKEKQRTQVRKGNIGFIFQSFNLIDELNVYENVELPLVYLKKKSSEKKKLITDILNRMNISHRAKHFPQQLSGGQQQRVAIARAIVAAPKLILADEPTGNLDSKNGSEVMNLLTELNQEGTTIIMVTHSQHDASYAHRVINLFDGQILTETKNEQITKS